MPSTYSVAQYITDLRAIRNTGSATAETSFYPPIERLLNGVGATVTPKVLFSTQLRNQGAGMPDGGFFPQPLSRQRRSAPPLIQNPERGVVEIKPPGYDLNRLTTSRQTIGYLQHYGLVLITNLHEFRLLEHSQTGTPRVREKYLFCSAEELWDESLSILAVKHKALLPDFLTRVILYRAPLAQPKDVASLLASYAREAKARSEDHPLESFSTVKATLQEALGIHFDGEKGARFFRSTLIQTLFYGIFSAWVLWRRSPGEDNTGSRFDWRISAHYLRVPVLRKLFGEVAEPGALNSVQLIEVLNLAGEALNRVHASFFDRFDEHEAVAYFYEPFLEAFDPQLRKELGVWYTPKEIVEYMVEQVDRTLRADLNQPLGLASPAVRVLDPCCGTGAYLTAVLEKIHRTLIAEAGDDVWQVANQLRAAALNRVFGFEIMPAPFVIAHLQIATVLEKAGAPLGDNDRARVYLTNALTGWIPETHPQSVLSEEFRHEREASEHIKQLDQILVIIGNPPYNGYAQIATMTEEQNLTADYKLSVPGLPRPEGKGLNDLYVRFFRIAERRVLGAVNASGNQPQLGIICLISNSSWLDGFSHPTMRSRMLSNFNRIQIDNLNGDKYRTGKTTPSGENDPSVFSTDTNSEGIQTGVAITTLIKSGPGHTDAIAIRSLWGTEKLSQLRQEATVPQETRYDMVVPEPLLGIPFANLAYSNDYLRWPLVSAFFQTNFNGIQTSQDNLLVDIDQHQLASRMQRFFHERGEQHRFQAWRIRRVLYRPFDLRFIYWEGNTGLLHRSVEEYVGGHYQNVSLILPKQNRGGYAGPFTSRTLVDLNCVDGGANTYAEDFLTSTPMHGSVVNRNWTSIVDDWADITGLASSDMLFHILAVSHCPSYHLQNVGALQRDWPRIPTSTQADIMATSSSLGQRLDQLLDAEQSPQFGPAWTFLGSLKLPVPQRLDTDLDVTADWGRLQDSKVMPGNGRIAQRDWTDGELARLRSLAVLQGVSVEQTLVLLGAQCVDISLNEASFWSAVPTKVWDYRLGGYQVLKKWLSYRDHRVLSRRLEVDEAAYFSQIVRRLSAVLLLGPELDLSYGELIVASPNG